MRKAILPLSLAVALAAAPQALVSQEADEAVASPSPVRIIASPFLVFDWSDAFSASVVLRDFDNDGDIDIAVANGRHWPQMDMVYLNIGNGRMLESYPIGDSSLPTYQLLPEDLDKDGDLDLIAILDELPARIYLNDGKGRFEFASEIEGTGGDSRGGTLADIDGDGIADLIIARRGDPDLILKGITGGSFGPPSIVGPAESNSIRVTAADIDGNGSPDLLFARRGGLPNMAYLNDGTGAFEAIALPGGVGQSRQLITAQLDGEGGAEIVACNLEGQNQAFRFERGEFIEFATFGSSGEACYSVASADFDGDGRDEIVVANSEAPDFIYYLARPARFGRSTLEESEDDTYGVAIADISGDGVADIVLAKSGSPNPAYIIRRAAR